MNSHSLKLGEVSSGQQDKIASLTSIIECSLKEFLAYVRTTNWWGRENEAVSLYTMGFLIPQCSPQSAALASPMQICIEGAVPQNEGNGKKLVRKDLLIWEKEGATCWRTKDSPTNYPLTIIEWKVIRTSTSHSGFDKNRLFTKDIHWLETFSKRSDSFVGFAVTLDLSKSAKLTCAKIAQSATQFTWLSL